jgi:hypothetical protein
VHRGSAYRESFGCARIDITNSKTPIGGKARDTESGHMEEHCQQG